MTADDKLTLSPATAQKRQESLSFALRYAGRKRHHRADETMARIVAAHRLLIARDGELCLVDFAVMHLSCAECDGGGRVSARLARLCDPGCGMQRG